MAEHLSLGSLFTGAAMLDAAVCDVLGAQPAWFVENDPAACKVLGRRWPNVPNHGDITRIDWADVEPVDVLCGGFPCQDISASGKRVGLRPGTRSGLWSHMAYAISQLKPKLVVIENVRGLLSADAYCELEPHPWGLGNGTSRPLRALGAVLGDLAANGYDAEWCGLRASDVGAAHGRFRVFITAWPIAHTPGDRWGKGWPEPTREFGGSDAALSGNETSTYTASIGPVRAGGARRRREGPADLGDPATDSAGTRQGPRIPKYVQANSGAPVPAGQTEPRRRNSTVADTNVAGFESRSGLRESAGQAVERDDSPPTAVDWGIYEPAIRRWEIILGRTAPSPTVTGKRGAQQLSPAFTEWLMGWPEGWVTDVPGLTRNDMLKICGNGVVVLQAVAALRVLLSNVAEHVA